MNTTTTAGWRRVAAVAGAGTLALGLAACSAQPQQPEPEQTGPVTLKYWTWVQGAVDAVDTWNSQNPDIQIDLELIPLGNDGGYAKMFQALTAGNAPCLANIEHRQLPAFIAEDGVTDIKELAAPYKDRFVESLWNSSVYGDAQYAIPNSSGPMAMYYRADLFEQAGIDVPTTWAEYADAAAQLAAASPGTAISAFSTNDSAWFASLAEQRGATWFDTDGESWIIDIDSDASVEVAEYWQDLMDAGYVRAMPTSADEWYLQLQNDQIATWLSANWGAALLEANVGNTTGKWRVVELPQWEAGASRSANWGGSATAVLAGCDHPAQAVEFAAWLQSDATSIQKLLSGGAGWPAMADLSEVPAASEENEFFGGEVVNDVFRDAVKNISANWRWSPTTPVTLDYLRNAFQDVANGDTTLTEVLAGAQTATVDSLDSAGFPVTER